MTKTQAKRRIAKLRQEIERHRYLYHVLDRQEISDAALDSLKKELADLEQQFPDLITPDSPTQRVGGKPLPEFKQVRHQTPMLSLQDAFSKADLARWEERNKKIVAEDFDYFFEPKIDGVAAALVYQNGRLQQAVTRGNGTIGEDVTRNIKTIEAIPLILRQNTEGRIEVRGEVYILKKDFDKMNAERKKEGKPLFANPRNIAAGSIRQLNPKIAAERPLRFFAWEITAGLALKTRMQEYKKLQQLGFRVPPGGQLFKTLAAADKHLAKEEKRRQRYPFLVDGAVIKINNLALAQRLGIVGKAPRGSIAYKFSAEEATTIIEEIVVQVGRTGALTPVAHLRPVRVAGTTVSRATLHNADEIKRKDVRVGDTVIVRKAGDIIPEVVKVLPKLRPKGAKPFQSPSQCPVCRSVVAKAGQGGIIHCTNKRCFPRKLQHIIHALGKNGFDIDGLGDKIIDQLLQEGLIEDAPDVWQLTAGDLTPLERFASKKAGKLVSEIQAHKIIPLGRFLTALGIPQVGTVTAQDLAREYRTLESFQNATQEQLQHVAGVGQKVAQEIVNFLRSEHAQVLIKKYRRAGIEIASNKVAGPLAGQTFVFTGSLGDMTRNEAKQRVVVLGGKVTSTVADNVDYVVIGAEPGSKANKAKRQGVKILTPKIFKRMIQEL